MLHFWVATTGIQVTIGALVILAIGSLLTTIDS